MVTQATAVLPGLSKPPSPRSPFSHPCPHAPPSAPDSSYKPRAGPSISYLLPPLSSCLSCSLCPNALPLRFVQGFCTSFRSLLMDTCSKTLCHLSASQCPPSHLLHLFQLLILPHQEVHSTRGVGSSQLCLHCPRQGLVHSRCFTSIYFCGVSD